MLGSGRRPALLWLGALVALAAGWLCAPAPLRASCGDYVLLGPAAHDPAPAPRHQPPAPCHGPMCSGGSLPPLAPPTLPPTAPDQWGDLVRPWYPEGPERFAWFAVPELRRLPGDASSVYHPPRTVSTNSRA